jgi:hypothetical protein
MKSGLKVFLALIAILILSGIIFFFWQRGPHLPHAQTPQVAGTLIPKNQLVFAGYKTPESALESALWAFQNGNYDVAVASVSPKDQNFKNMIRTPALFQSMAKEETEGFKSIQMLAKKMLGNDTVELKYQIIHDGQTNCLITPAEKTGSEWKINFDGADSYTTNWDKSGDVVTFSN